MTVMTKAMREDVLEGVLTEAFRERFNEIAVQLTGFVRASVQANHPVFCQLVKDTVAKPYLAIDFSPSVYRATEKYKSAYFQPEYGIAVACPEQTWKLGDSVSWLPIKDVEAPQRAGDTVIPAEHAINRDYLALWADYTAAQAKLDALLRSYKSREKFEADFPDFARHLPTRVFTAPLPTVIVKDVLQDLAKVGVPKKAEPGKKGKAK